ncbi:WD repeat-containing protein jip5 [Arachnomyces sp. PD_36]|nr:WD repeat-containing protein jip5 [Arachnomyces sp. PD_36]
MFDTICTLPLSSDLFTQAIHPTEPIVSVGLSSGRVQTFRLPPTIGEAEENGDRSGSKIGTAVKKERNGFGHIDTVWETRRHKGSCRCLGYGVDGEKLYSAGTDGLVKIAKSETGVVESKIAIPQLKERSLATVDSPTVIHALSPQTLLLATDSSALHLYDLRVPSTSISAKPQQTHHPHADYISSLTPLPPSDTSTSGFSKQWVTTGGTTLAVTDLRRGVMVRSEDQEEELISSVMVGGLKAGGTSKGEKVIVGGGGGVLTLWEKGQWDDQDERIIVDRSGGGGESIETLSKVPDDLGMGKLVAVGLGDGRVEFVELGPNKVVSKLVHDEFEGVVGLGFDSTGRMVSGGGTVVKVWHEAVANEEDEEDANGKRMMGSDSDDDGDSSDEEMGNRKRSKKQKKGKAKGKGGDDHVMAFRNLD